MKIENTLEVMFRNWPAKVISLAAAIILFFAYKIVSIEERAFSVPLNIIVPEDMIITNGSTATVGLILRGSEEIFTLSESDFDISADFSHYDTEGTYREPIRIVKQGKATRMTLEIETGVRDIEINLEKKITKRLKVLPTWTGTPSAGFELTQFFITPDTVTIEGARREVDSMEFVKTGEIDLTALNSEFTTNIYLNTDDRNIRFPGGDLVEVYGIIEEKLEVKTFSNPDIISYDLKSGFIPQYAIDNASITLQGNIGEIEELTQDDVRLIVDCSAITEPGSYQLEVVPDYPPGLVLLRYTPAETTVEFLAGEE